jgi:iron complex outermembrane recepter protein
VPTFQTTRPAGYKSDTLTNNELGLKTEFLNHRLVMNASAYWMRWNDVQSLLFDLSHLGTASYIAQGPNYTIKGVALQLVARITEGLTLQGSSSWNSSSQIGAPCLRSAGVTAATPYNPTPLGECITIVNGAPYTNPWDPSGSSLPYSPPSQFSLQARYEWNTGAFRPFATVGVSHIGSMHTSPQNFPDGNDPAQTPPTIGLLRYTIPGYTTYDGAFGVSRDAWTAQITGSNLTNAYGPTNISSAQFIRAEIPLRPRVVMAQFAYSF